MQVPPALLVAVFRLSPGSGAGAVPRKQHDQKTQIPYKADAKNLRVASMLIGCRTPLGPGEMEEMTSKRELEHCSAGSNPVTLSLSGALQKQTLASGLRFTQFEPETKERALSGVLQTPPRCNSTEELKA